MISYLTWKIIELEINTITILTSSGVWYEVLINELIYSKLINEKNIAEIFIYHHKTENSENLFWFLEKEEKKVFKQLIKISWVWWKVAMQIIWIWIIRLLEAISWEDNKTIESIKWIWKKSAEKIILELKDKDFWINFDKNDLLKNTRINPSIKKSVIESLTNMWYEIKSIEKILNSCPEEFNNVEKIIPYVIKRI